MKAIYGLFGVMIAGLLILSGNVAAWSNGGYTPNPYTDVNDIPIGTHDQIAASALLLAGNEDLEWIATEDNCLEYFLLGTEYPDNSNTPGFQDGGDTSKHHIYFSRNTFAMDDCYDDSAAVRAQEMYALALEYYDANNKIMTAFCLGAMTHYISDVAVFGHLMGSDTVFGAEDTSHHSTFEEHANSNLEGDASYEEIEAMIESDNFELNDYAEQIQIGLTDPMLRDQMDTLEVGGHLAPYNIVIQLARISMFAGEEFNLTDREDTKDYFLHEGMIINDDGYPFFMAPYVEYKWDITDITRTKHADALPNEWHLIDSMSYYELYLAIFGVAYALEQFPSNPSYTTIYGDTNDGGDDDDGVVDDATNFFSTCCSAVILPVGGAMLFFIAIPAVVGKKENRRKE